MKRTEQKFLKYIDEQELINPGDKILVGFSGGPDSVFLLYMLYKFKVRLKITLSAVHIHHNLRGKEADEDEEFCRIFCQDNKIPFLKVKKNVRAFSKKNNFSLEEAGRIIRYEEFRKILRQNKLDKIATAHNANDNTETVLLNLIKGTGLDGISGIPVKRENVIRPILCFTRDEILSYLKNQNIQFRSDKTNEQSDYERNYLRNKVLPLIKERLNPSIDNALMISSENFRNIKDYILNTEKDFFNRIESDSSGKIKIRVEDLKIVKESLQGFLLKTLLERKLKIQVFSKDVRKLFSLITAQTGKKVELSGNIVVIKEREYLKIIPVKNYEQDFSAKISIGETINTPEGLFSIKKCDRNSIIYSNYKNKEYISADQITSEFIIRKWKPGDSFHPLGMRGSKKISDFLNEQKVESFGKKRHLILLNNNKIVWVVGLRIDDRFKITPSTQQLLELCLN